MAEVLDDGHVLHQIANGISKRTVGGAFGVVLDHDAEVRMRLEGGARAESRLEGAW